MKISHNWLQQFINIPLSPQETAEVLTDIGLEVEKIEKKEAIPGGLSGLVIGEVLTTKQHPNADKLKLTEVNIGQGEPLKIVCGAPNVAPNQKVVVATVGATLYPEDGEPFKIKKSKIRGEESEGMLCAEDEIGLGKGNAGIMVLEETIKPGIAASDYFNLKEDWMYEIGLTPNRADAMSHWGVARDLFVAMKHKGIIENDVEMCTPSVSDFKVDNQELNIEIEVEDANLCSRYAGVTISGVTIKESPDWLKQKLKSIDLSPINNVVDITNYILHELGQPLHAFDADKISGNKVIVKTLPSDTKFTTLDETERKLSEQDLMICNNQGGMCIAGVFGGAESGVTNNTTKIFLESAYFNPVSVRKTAKRHGLSTDASFRFERGIDPNITIYALKRAALLIKEVAGGTISSEIKEFYPSPITNNEVKFNIERCNSLIGKNIPKETILNIINLLEIDVIKDNGNDLMLSVPPYRNDVTREADVVEEVLRIYGFNNIDIPEKLNTSIAYKKDNKEELKNIISDLLSSNGFYETMANSLTKSKYVEQFNSNQIKPEFNVKMLNPLSSDLDVMRQNLLFNGLEAIAYNNNRQIGDIKFYEFGKIYQKHQDKFEETNHLTLFLSGNKNAENWNTNSTAVSFHDLKQAVENILNRLGIFKNAQISETDSPYFDYGLNYSINRQSVVNFGLVSHNILQYFDCKHDVFYAELNWDTILNLMVMNKIKFKELPKYPSSRRDLSLLLDKQVSFGEIKEIAEKVDRKILREIGLFDIYQGKNLEENKKSYAVSFVFRDDNQTIQDKQVDKIMTKIQAELETKLGATLR